MPKGGKRPNAGRKKNVPNKATQERQARVAKDGPTPLDVLLDGMRFHHKVARMALEAEPIEAKVVALALKEAREFARDAAPYVHPRLATVEHGGKDGGPIRVTISGVDRGLL